MAGHANGQPTSRLYMVVHMVQLACSEPQGIPVDVLKSNVEEWVNDQNEVLSNQRQTFDVLTDEDDNTYMRGGFRFDHESHEPSGLMNGMINVIEAQCDWYRVRYHVCDHDEDDRGGCEWETVNTSGTVPDYI